MRKIGFVPVVLLVLSASGCSIENRMPNFNNGEKINFIAYAGPCKPIYSGINTQTDDNYRMISEAGFTHVLALYNGSYIFKKNESNEANFTRGYLAAKDDADIALDLCEKYGLKYYVRDWNLQGMGFNVKPDYDMKIFTQEEMDSAMDYIFPDDCTYIRHPAYAGNYICDEPFSSDLAGAGRAVKAYTKRMNELGVTGYKPYVNLLPNTAGGNSLGSGYSDYLNKYLNYMGRDLGYVSYDAYPLKKYDESEYVLKSLYLNNLQTTAELCNKENIKLCTYVQSKGDYTGIRDIESTADIRFQVYCNLAFGSYDMTYYEYGGLNSDNEGSFSLFNLVTGKYNWTYNCAKTVNREVHAFENIITNYRYDNIMVKSVDSTYECQGFLCLKNPLKNFDNASFESVTQNTFMTRMVNKNDDSQAYMLMNYSDPGLKENDTVTIKFKNASHLVMYRYGQKMTVKLPITGKYTFKLGPGEGRFIIPIK